MGICNSKQSPASHAASEAGQQLDSAAADKEGSVAQSTAAQQADNGANGGAASQPAEAVTPATPSPANSPDDDQQVHTYNSTEKPYKSAMRASDAAKSDTYSRRSSSGVSNVGFAVTMDAPDAEHHKNFAGADSISLKKILDIFYDKVTSDALLGPFFIGIDMIKLKRHQLRFMSLAFGGKDLVFEEDPNLNLRKVHYHLIRDKGLSLNHWEEFVRLFQETLDQLDRELPEETRSTAMRSILATKHYFVPIGQETEYTNASISALPDESAAGGETRV